MHRVECSACVLIDRFYGEMKRTSDAMWTPLDSYIQLMPPQQKTARLSPIGSFPGVSVGSLVLPAIACGMAATLITKCSHSFFRG